MWVLVTASLLFALLGAMVVYSTLTVASHADDVMGYDDVQEEQEIKS